MLGVGRRVFMAYIRAHDVSAPVKRRGPVLAVGPACPSPIRPVHRLARLSCRVRRAVNARSVGQDGHDEGTQELEQEPADPQPRVRHTEPCGHRLLRGHGLRDRPDGAGWCSLRYLPAYRIGFTFTFRFTFV